MSKFLSRYVLHNCEVELYLTKDIILNETRASAMVNPTNTLLEGTACSYFPKGGPVPQLEKHMKSSAWGGMGAGENMLYPMQCVDGRVTAEGGAELKHLLARKGSCKTGESFVIPACGALRLKWLYEYLIYTVTPFFNDEHYPDDIKNCYSSVLKEGNRFSITSIALPLLGAGSRGIPIDIASNLAVQAITKIAPELPFPISIRFMLLGAPEAKCLQQSFSQAIQHI